MTVALSTIRPNDTIEVWASTEESPTDMGWKQGTVAQVVHVGGFLSTRIDFTDGRSVYARPYAKTRHLTRHLAAMTDTEAMDRLLAAWNADEVGDDGFPGADAVDLIGELLRGTGRITP